MTRRKRYVWMPIAVLAASLAVLVVFLLMRKDNDAARMNRQIIIQYRIEGWGTADDLARRHRIEDLLDAALRAQGMGECDGGDIGSGTMNIFVFVRTWSAEPLLCCGPFDDNGELDDAIVAVSPAEDDEGGEQKVIWPEGHNGPFSVL